MAEILSIEMIEREKQWAYCKMVIQSHLAKRGIEARDHEAAARHASQAAHFANKFEAALQRIEIAVSVAE